MKVNLRLFAAVFIFLSLAHTASAEWEYTETNTVENGVSKGSLTDGVWTFYAERAKGAVSELTVDASKGVSIDPAAPAKIDFTEIQDGYKVVKFVGWRNANSPLCHYTTELIAPDCTSLSGQDAFSGNLNLTKVQLCEEGPISFAGTPDRCFKNCKNLVTFEPRKLKGIVGGSTFESCSKIEGSFEFIDATSVNGGTFSGCSKLGEIKLEKVTTIGQSAFNGCSSLSNIVCSTPVEYISNYAFQGCGKITTETVQSLLSKNLKRLGNSVTDRAGCFKDCTGLTGTMILDLPNLATNVVPYRLFYGCTSLERVEIKTKDLLVDIGSEAFLGLKNGKDAEVVMPKNVIKGTFAACATLSSDVPYTKVYIKGNVEAWLEKMKAHNFVLPWEKFEDTSWEQYQSGWNWTTKWPEMRDRMIKDTQMCTTKTVDGVEYPVILDKRVVAFVYYRSNAVPGWGCWVLDDQTKGFSVMVR